MLSGSEEWCEGAVVVVRRCTLAFWQDIERSSAIWDKFGGEVLWAELMARQCLALEAAAASAERAGIQWLIHIDADEALLFATNKDGGTGAQGAAVRFFAALPGKS